MSTARRDFLRHAGLSAAALATLPSMAQASVHPAAGRPISVGATGAMAQHRAELLAELEALTNVDTQPPAQQWDTSWTAKVNGKHKAMFDVPQVEGGVGVMRAAIWGRQYMDVLKLAPGDVSTVIVIRHAGIPLIMNQEFWTTYKVGKERKIKNDDGKTQELNPVLGDPAKPPQGAMASYMLDQQIAAGTIVLGCNMAFRAVVSLIEKKDKVPTAEARTKALTMIVPGVILQPSGIFGNVMAEEAGCVFVQGV